MRNLARALGCMLLIACACYSATIINLDYVIEGATPEGPTPWLTATFTDVSGGVQLEMTAANLVGGEKVAKWLFNVAGFDVLTDLAFVFQSSPAAVPEPSVILSGMELKADGDGTYDFGFAFSTGNDERFSSGTVVYLITGPSTLDSTDFAAYSVGGAKGAYLSAAHVLGTTQNPPSGFIAARGVVPEPSTMVLFGAGIGLIGLGAALRRQIRG